MCCCKSCDVRMTSTRGDAESDADDAAEDARGRGRTHPSRGVTSRDASNVATAWIDEDVLTERDSSWIVTNGT